MEPAVTFNDIFEEADDKLGLGPRPSFSKDHYGSDSLTSGIEVDHSSRLKLFQAGILGSWTSISIFAFSIFVIAVTSAYYINSYLVVRKRLRDLAAAELQQRRHYHIPDHDKRPLHIARPEAQARWRKEKARLREKQEADMAAQHSRSSDHRFNPNGYSVNDHLTREALILEEEQHRQKALEQGSLFGRQPGRASSLFIKNESPEENQRELVSLIQRPSSPSKLSSGDARHPPWGRGSAQLPPTNGSIAEDTLRPGSRKRLFMDRQQSELEVDLKSEQEKDPASSITLKKRQRTNTWGADAANGFIPPVQDSSSQKRRAEFDEPESTTKRVRQSTGGLPSRKLPNGAVPIRRLGRLSEGQANGDDKPHVTFAPTPESSADGSAEPPPKSLSRGTKRDREATIPEEGDEEGSTSPSKIAATNGQPPTRKRRANGAESKEDNPNSNGIENGITSTPSKNGEDKENEKNGSNTEGQRAPGSAQKVARAPGEEWGPPGMRFKMRHDGVTLRGGMVRELMPKYHMPVDSIHYKDIPKIPVVVEKWFTPEDYAAAEAAGEFKWQHEEEPAVSASGSVSRSRSLVKERAHGTFWDTPDISPAPKADGTTFDRRFKPAINPFALSGDGLASASRSPIRSRMQPIRHDSTLSASSKRPLTVSGQLSRSVSQPRWMKQEIEKETLRKLKEGLEQSKANKELAQSGGVQSNAFGLGSGNGNTSASSTISSTSWLPPAPSSGTPTAAASTPTSNDGGSATSGPSFSFSSALGPTSKSDDAGPSASTSATSLFPAVPSISSQLSKPSEASSAGLADPLKSAERSASTAKPAGFSLPSFTTPNTSTPSATPTTTTAAPTTAASFQFFPKPSENASSPKPNTLFSLPNPSSAAAPTSSFGFGGVTGLGSKPSAPDAKSTFSMTPSAPSAEPAKTMFPASTPSLSGTPQSQSNLFANPTNGSNVTGPSTKPLFGGFNTSFPAPTLGTAAATTTPPASQGSTTPSGSFTSSGTTAVNPSPFSSFNAGGNVFKPTGGSAINGSSSNPFGGVSSPSNGATLAVVQAAPNASAQNSPAPGNAALPSSSSANPFALPNSGSTFAFGNGQSGSGSSSSTSAPQNLIFKGAASNGPISLGGASTAGAPANGGPTFGNKSWVNPDYNKRGAGPSATAAAPPSLPSLPIQTANSSLFAGAASPAAGAAPSFGFGAPATQSAETFTSPVRLSSPSFATGHPGPRPVGIRSGSRSSRPPQRAPR